MLSARFDTSKLEDIQRRLRMCAALQRSVKYGAVGLFLTALYVVATRLIALPAQPYLFVALGLVGFVLGAIIGLRKCPSLLDVAILTDLKADTREVVSTAYQLHLDSRPSPFREALLVTAEDTLSTVKAKQVARLPFGKRYMYPVLLALAIVGLNFIPAKMPGDIQAGENLLAGAKEIALLQTMEKKLENAKTPRNEKDIVKIQTKIQTFTGEIKAGSVTAKRAVAKINDIKRDIETLKRKEQSRAETFDKFKEPPAKDWAEAIKSGDDDKVKAALEKLKQELASSPEAREKFKEQLKAAIEGAKDDPALKKALLDAQKAFDKGDYNEMAKKLAEAAKQLQGADDKQKTIDALGDAARDADSLRKELAAKAGMKEGSNINPNAKENQNQNNPDGKNPQNQAGKNSDGKNSDGNKDGKSDGKDSKDGKDGKENQSGKDGDKSGKSDGKDSKDGKDGKNSDSKSGKDGQNADGKNNQQNGKDGDASKNNDGKSADGKQNSGQNANNGEEKNSGSTSGDNSQNGGQPDDQKNGQNGTAGKSTDQKGSNEPKKNNLGSGNPDSSPSDNQNGEPSGSQASSPEGDAQSGSQNGQGGSQGEGQGGQGGSQSGSQDGSQSGAGAQSGKAGDISAKGYRNSGGVLGGSGATVPGGNGGTGFGGNGAGGWGGTGFGSGPGYGWGGPGSGQTVIGPSRPGTRGGDGSGVSDWSTQLQGEKIKNREASYTGPRQPLPPKKVEPRKAFQIYDPAEPMNVKTYDARVKVPMGKTGKTIGEREVIDRDPKSEQSKYTYQELDVTKRRESAETLGKQLLPSDMKSSIKQFFTEDKK